MFWSRNKRDNDEQKNSGRPADRTPVESEKENASMPARTGRMPPGFVYGHMGGVPLHRPLKISAGEVQEIFKGLPPEMIAKVAPERLATIARGAYIMAEGQVHAQTAIASLGVDALAKRFATRLLTQAAAAEKGGQS